MIAELKRGSPSAGMIDKNLDIGEKASTYSSSGVCGISVLTCEPYFYGSPDDLKEARKAVDLPILIKDFIFDSYQILQGRSCGADAVLLIMRILTDEDFNALSDTAASLGMETLVEVHTRKELERALGIIENWDSRMLGINNRNLETLETDLSVSLDLIKFIPRDKIMVISESGIRERSDVQAMKEAGFKGVLVGESILKSADTRGKIRELM